MVQEGRENQGCMLWFAQSAENDLKLCKFPQRSSPLEGKAGRSSPLASISHWSKVCPVECYLFCFSAVARKDRGTSDINREAPKWEVSRHALGQRWGAVRLRLLQLHQSLRRARTKGRGAGKDLKWPIRGLWCSHEREKEKIDTGVHLPLSATPCSHEWHLYSFSSSERET